MKIMQTFPSIQVLLDDGVTLEIIKCGDNRYLISFYEKDDIPGMADPLNSIELDALYRVEDV